MKLQLKIWFAPKSEKIEFKGKSYQINSLYLSKARKILYIRGMLTSLCMVLSFFYYFYVDLAVGFGIWVVGVLIIMQLLFIPVYVICFPNKIEEII